jgi:subtilisin family serine protease
MKSRLPRTNRHLLLLAGLWSIAACSDGPGLDRLLSRKHLLSAAALPPTAPVDLGRSAVVTLITGDRVHLEPGADGQPVVAVQAAPGREQIQFVSYTTKNGLEQDAIVIPADAVSLIEAGRLDRQLFNVSELVRQGLDDERETGLPLIVTHGERTAGVFTLAGGRTVRRLASIRGQAVVEDKREAAAFWRGLTAGVFTAGVEKVWLDARAQLLLDESAPQIGAPAAWAAGLTGAGVTVAVLDTGVKADHPDLAGKITEAADFTGTRPDAGDDVGHGTHVAGTIAGSGAASGGRYRGIAPDASLVVGKVCVAGGCTSSAIIAGMEWAAARARIVSMSLGSTTGSDGSDPLSIAANNLTAQHGTLFVAAAGNSGRAESVSAPAAADAALAVGSLDKTGGPSSFSSRGPRVGDYAVKPEIAAPGRNIVAARAIGTPNGDSAPVDDNYARLSGTSMATPHVSGSAALLAQRHPDWKAEQIKAALMSSAQPVEGTRPWDTGVGRVDLARAVAQRVYATGNLSFGLVPWPHTGEPVSRGITYHNDGDAPITLALQLTATAEDGSPAPEGLFAVDPQVNVPAHGSATVTVTMSPRPQQKGLFSARLTASDGKVTVTSVAGVFQEPQRFHLTIESIDRNGEPPSWAFGFLLDIGTAQSHSVNGPGGTRTLLLERGEYDLHTLLSGVDGSIVASQPNIVLDRDVTVTLDGRLSRPITVTAVDRPEATLFWNSVSLHSKSISGTGVTTVSLSQQPFFAIPTRPATGHVFALDYRSWLHPPPAPAGGAPAEDYVYNLVFPMVGQIPEDLDLEVSDGDLGAVQARYHAQGACTAIRTNFGPSPTGASGYLTNIDQPIPGRRLEYYTAGIRWTETLYLYPPSGPTLFNFERSLGHARYQPGQRLWRHWNSAPIGPSFGPAEPLWGAYRINNTMSVYLTPFSPGEREHATLAFTGATTLLRDGTAIGSSPRAAYGQFTVPADAGEYTIEATGTRVVPWSVLGTAFHGSWTFRSEPSADASLHRLPLLLVRVSTAVDENDSAPSGQPYPLFLRVQRQDGAPFFPVTELHLEVSYDDGASWEPTPVQRLDDRGLAVVQHPVTPGFISLRASVRDAGGNSASHATLRAYRTR